MDEEDEDDAPMPPHTGASYGSDEDKAQKNVEMDEEDEDDAPMPPQYVGDLYEPDKGKAQKKVEVNEDGDAPMHPQFIGASHESDEEQTQKKRITEERKEDESMPIEQTEESMNSIDTEGIRVALEPHTSGSDEEGLAVALPVDISKEDGPVYAALEYTPEVPFYKKGRYILGIIVILLVFSAVVVVAVVYSTKEIAGGDEEIAGGDEPLKQLSDIELYIQSNVLQRNASWDDMANDDPRHLALNWILHQDKLQLRSLDERLSQRYICALLAFSFDSLAWNFCGNHTLPGNAGEEHAASSCLATDQTGQEKNYSVWLSDTYECDWYGVTCENETVIGLELNSNSLIGEIPPEISKLNITLLSLKDNCIFGTIPQEMGSMKRLQELDLEHNSLSGTFPDELTDLINLVKLNLFEQYKESNRNPNPDSCTGSNGTVFNSAFARGDEACGEHLGLSGNILGSQIGKLQSLEEIKIDYNSFSGLIASEIGTLKKLVILGAGHNGFNGTIPQEMTELTSLEKLRLGFNKLSGGLPNGIGDMTSLVVLNTGDNYDMEGTFPEEITQLTSLRELRLDNCWGISGELPKDIGNMRSLEILSLNAMSLEGEIPNSLYNLSNLKELWLTDNRPGLHGTLSPNIGNLTKLTHLVLDSNRLLTGTLPLELGRCKDLELLWLDNTGINGTAPAEVCDLQGEKLYSEWGEVFRTDCSPNNGTLDPYFTCECCDTCCDHTTHLCMTV